MSELAADNYFFDDPGYWHPEESGEPSYVQRFISLRPEVAAINAMITARIHAHSESDTIHLEDAEGEQ